MERSSLFSDFWNHVCILRNLLPLNFLPEISENFSEIENAQVSLFSCFPFNLGFIIGIGEFKSCTCLYLANLGATQYNNPG